jgi:hypothetical protein
MKSRRKRWAGNVARIGENMKAYMLLVRKPEGRRPLGRPIVSECIILRWILGWNGVD